MNKNEIVDNIIYEAYRMICNKLEENGIKYDSYGDDCIFYDDESIKKTFAINIYQHECPEYEGE